MESGSCLQPEALLFVVWCLVFLFLFCFFKSDPANASFFGAFFLSRRVEDLKFELCLAGVVKVNGDCCDFRIFTVILLLTRIISFLGVTTRFALFNLDRIIALMTNVILPYLYGFSFQ